MWSGEGGGLGEGEKKLAGDRGAEYDGVGEWGWKKGERGELGDGKLKLDG